MARHVRIRVCGGWYHVFSRGHNREGIFSDRGDYVHFLEQVEAMRERLRVRAYAYCLMANHFHLPKIHFAITSFDSGVPDASCARGNGVAPRNTNRGTYCPLGMTIWIW